MDFEQAFSGLDSALLSALGDDAVVDAGATIRGLFESPWMEPHIGAIRTSVQEPSFKARTVDLVNVTENSVLTIKGNNYEIIPPFETDTSSGMTKLILRPMA